jgi:hypothetical protein
MAIDRWTNEGGAPKTRAEKGPRLEFFRKLYTSREFVPGKRRAEISPSSSARSS